MRVTRWALPKHCIPLHSLISCFALSWNQYKIRDWKVMSRSYPANTDYNYYVFGAHHNWLYKQAGLQKNIINIKMHMHMMEGISVHKKNELLYFGMWHIKDLELLMQFDQEYSYYKHKSLISLVQLEGRKKNQCLQCRKRVAVKSNNSQINRETNNQCQMQNANKCRKKLSVWKSEIDAHLSLILIPLQPFSLLLNL